ncbi:hypothetical protein PFLmoz3_03973 [Pseudomonas fluorescens]|uniref:Uncharacterized protein n=1 Tax=Pseudomonas fluorescens TaxID=294 RepID=A0A109LF51_PSEFL|nr:hypothetical protein PFLmoz3_03973 [Pseudomonas fluorescens]
MGLRETIAAKALDLLENLRGKGFGVAILQHAGAQALLMRLQAAVAFPGGHGAAQLVGLARAVVGGDHRDLHHLFLEQRDAQGALQHGLQLRRRIGGGLFIVPPPQVRMHHAALDRPGAHNGDLDHQVIKRLRLEPGQHRHLRPRLDLEHTDGVGLADHGVGGRVFLGNRGQAQVPVAMSAQQIEAAADRAEHAQGKDVHLEQTDGVEVVFVPLDNGALGHGRIFHRHQGVQRVFADHKAARVLGQVPRKTDQLLGQRQDTPQQWAVRVEAAFTQALQRRRLIAPAPAAIGQGVDLVRRQPEGLGHITYRARGVVTADHRRQGCTGAAIALEHVLQHLFAALVLKVHVDVRRLVALFGQEALEQQVGQARVDFGDAQGKTHRRVSRRTTALAQDRTAAGETHDVMHRKEIAFVTQLADQLQFTMDLLQGLVVDAFGPALGDAFFGEGAQPGLGVMPRGYQLAWIVITQLAEVEGAAPREGEGFIQQGLGVQRRQRVEAAQVAFAIGVQARASFGHRHVVTDGGHGVLQGTAASRMHMHIAAGHGRDLQAVGQLQALLQMARIVLPTVQVHRQPQALVEGAAQPVEAGLGVAVLRHPQRQQAGQRLLEIFL